MKKEADCYSFTHKNFKTPLPEHKKLTEVTPDGKPLNDPMFNWEYFGFEKYGRYAVCKNTLIKRGLTMGEFYGTGIVD